MNKVCFGCDNIRNDYTGKLYCYKASSGYDSEGYSYYRPSCIHDSMLSDYFEASDRSKTIVSLNDTIKDQYKLLSNQKHEILNLRYKIDKFINL